jgi:uncharacterized protein YjbI with pentapeptide repeats
MPPDYSEQNLSGRSFKGKNLVGANFKNAILRGSNFKNHDLTGADFSGADIRSADFSGANLTGANFSGAKAGLQRRWAALLLAVSWAMAAVAGFLSAFVGNHLMMLISDRSFLARQIGGLASIVVVIIFLIITIRQGIQTALQVGAITFAVAGAINITGAFTGAYLKTIAGAIALAVAGAINIAGIIAGAIAFAFAGTIAIVFAFTIAIAFAFTLTFAIAFVIAVAFNVTGAFTIAGVLVLFSIYISVRALKGDPKQALIHDIAIAFAAFKGTSFCNANLTDANFTGANLKGTDFRKAVLNRACFHNAKKLNRIRPGSSYLKNPQVQQVLVTRQGLDKNFDHLDLRGVNFKGAILIDASFMGADLSEANLQDADLSRAKLVQAQLDETDFTGANLTGAYVEDWGITNTTKFHGVRCQYVYMRLPTKENPDPLRKPDDNKQVFADGEFGDFIKPIFDTLDLYHNQGVDPRAIAISFKQLAQNHPEAELRVVGMEVSGYTKIFLHLML